MKKLFVSVWRSILIAGAGMLVLSSCVNEEYDLSKEIDTEMTMLKNVSMPVGSFERVSISEILTLTDDEGSLITKNDKGDYIFSFSGDEMSAYIEVPSFSIAPSGGIHTEPVEVHFSTGPAAGMNASIVTEDIVYSKISGNPLDASMDIELDAELPSEILDIRSVGLDASVNLNFTVQGGAVNLKEGFVLDFPDFLNVEKSNMSDTRFELIDNHKLTLKKDVKVSSASPLVFGLKLDKMDLPSGAISDGVLVVNEEVKVTGDFYLSPSDFSVIPEKLVISIKADITDLDVVSAEVKLAVDEKIPGSAMELDNLPEFLTGGDVCLDIYNPTLTFDISNSTPFSFGVKTGITGTRGTKEVGIALGEEQEINVPAESSVTYVLTRREQASGEKNCFVVPELGEMISMLPETISIDDITVVSADEDYVNIESDSRYQASIAYELYAPLAFDKDMKLSFDQEITDLGLVLGMDLSAISATLNIENSIPLDFTIAAKALDSYGNVMNDIDITVSKTVAAGSHENPVMTEVNLSIISKSGAVAFDGLQLSMKANGSSAMAGVALNDNQGFDINDLVITLPEGITITDTQNEKTKRRVINIITFAAVAFLSSVTVFGQQNLRTAYFLDGYTYRYKMNPAMAPERGFFAMPAIGNLGVGVESNMALSTFLYPTSNGNMTTFLSSSVSDQAFLDRLNHSNKLNVSINESIISTGYRVGKSFHTIDLSFKADVGAALPKDLFAFVKTGSSSGATSWDISRTGVRANARMELAYGYSRPIADWIRVGARLKVLMGIARADVLIDDLNLKMSGEEWAATAHGKAEVSGPLSFGTVSGTKEIDFGQVAVPEDIEEWNEYLSTPSIGAALDLGAYFDFLEYFTASVSVLDLGFIGWNSTTTAVMNGGKWSFDGFGTISTDQNSNIGDQFADLGDELMNMLKMEKTADAVKKSNMLAATIHAGVEARMPFYERLSFGLLGTQRIDGIYSWTEGRVSANLAPVNWFSLAASYAISNFGSSLGGVVNIHLPGFNLYAGLDSFLPLMNVTPQFVPIDSANTNITFGLTFSFGKAEGRYRK